MPDPTAEFFDELGRHGTVFSLRKINGTVRFELVHDQQIDHWHLAIANGNLTVSRGRREADTIIHTEKAVFDRLALGETKPLPALLRNDLTVAGRLLLFLVLERLFPGPPGARDPRPRHRKRRS